MTAAAAPSTEPRAMTLDEEEQRRFLGVRLYRANYLLPVTYNDNPNRNVPEAEGIDVPLLGDALDNVEMKFQLSFEVPVWTEILEQPLDLYFAYTQLAFFQAYNQEYSSPFRETNYEPEIGLNWRPDFSAFGWRLRSVRAMANHQSNGRSEPLSRSWNRLIGQLEAEHGDLRLGLRVWAPLETGPSDNPDIYEYLGYGELHASYDLKKHHFGLMLRNPTHPTIQVDWSYPLGETIRFYAQYFNGYGESLLDYDHSVNRIGAGFLVNEWP
jgi:phospholipase A1